MQADTDVWVRAAIIVLGSILGSGGLWAYLQSKDTKRNSTTSLMMGLAYMQLTALGQKYIDRGHITSDEYQDFLKYFYEPYKALGGNGAAQRIKDEVTSLPLRSRYAEELQVRTRDGEYHNNGRVVTRPEETNVGRP